MVLLLDFLRERYGKQFPFNHPGRQFEKIVSDYRKSFFAKLFKFHLLESYVSLTNKPLTKELFTQILREKQKIIDEMEDLLDILEKIFSAIEEILIDPSFTNLEEYIQVKEIEFYKIF